MSKKQPIQLFVPDTGPLISLALGNALDLLLLAADDVRIVLTDIVEFEATQASERFQDAKTIREFIAKHADRIDVIPTTIGRMALSDLVRRREAGEAASLPKDVGELSITNFVISLRTVNPGEPMLVLIEDEWFAANAYSLPGNVHVVSTSAWLDGLELCGSIPSAAVVRARIQAARPHFREDFLVDKEAEKVPSGTEWRSKFRRGPR